jgi:hypothetical protein
MEQPSLAIRHRSSTRRKSGAEKRGCRYGNLPVTTRRQTLSAEAGEVRIVSGEGNQNSHRPNGVDDRRRRQAVIRAEEKSEQGIPAGCISSGHLAPVVKFVETAWVDENFTFNPDGT